MRLIHYILERKISVQGKLCFPDNGDFVAWLRTAKPSRVGLQCLSVKPVHVRLRARPTAKVSLSRCFQREYQRSVIDYFQTSRNFQFFGNPISCKLRRLPPSPIIERIFRFKSLLGLIILLMYFMQHNAVNTLLGWSERDVFLSRNGKSV